MCTLDEINGILDRIAAGQQTPADIQALRDAITIIGDQIVVQGSNGINIGHIGQAGDIHINPTYHGADAETIEAVLRQILSEFQPLNQPTGIPENIPYSGVVKFVGRDESLDDLHELLHKEDRKAIAAISGMGGVGKTELAIQYALHHRDRETYKGGICWLEARSGNVGAQIVQFAQHLNLNPPQHLDLLGRVKYCYDHWPAGEVLMVLDDVEDLTDFKKVKPYLPPQLSRFKVLMTTRSNLGPSIAKLPLDVLQQEAAHELLQSIVGQERLQQEPEEAEELCKFVGCSPLALELVGRYLEPDPDLSLEEMRSRLEAKRLKHRSLIEADPTMTAERGVADAFELTWERFESSVQQLACLLSLFSPAPIPWSLVERVEKGQDSEDLECARKALMGSNFLKRVGEETYQEHRLIWEFSQVKREESAQANDLKKAFATAMVEVARDIPKTPTPDKIAEVAPYIPHVEKAATDLTDILEAEEQVCISRGLGRYYQTQGDYDQAEYWLLECLWVSQTQLRENHIQVATSLEDLAELYDAQSRCCYQKAETLKQEAEELRERLHREDRPDVAPSSDNPPDTNNPEAEEAENSSTGGLSSPLCFTNWELGELPTQRSGWLIDFLQYDFSDISEPSTDNHKGTSHNPPNQPNDRHPSQDYNQEELQYEETSEPDEDQPDELS